MTIDYRCEDRKKVGELRKYIGAIRVGLDYLFQKKKKKIRTVEIKTAFEDTAVKTGFEIVKF